MLLVVLWLLPLWMVLLLLLILLLMLLLLILLNIHLLLVLRILLLVLWVSRIWLMLMLMLMVLRLSSASCANIRQVVSRHRNVCSGLIGRRRVIRWRIHCRVFRSSFDTCRDLFVGVASTSKDTAFQSHATSFSSSSGGPPLLLLLLLLLLLILLLLVCAIHSRIIASRSDVCLTVAWWRDRGRGKSRLIFKPFRVLTRW
mmetsp:Transcript_20071/g.47059  ORF Transcript_20071/g.47059 Transcript_20071/m.47059 type:complete len:200 (-) Transcript_20071:460-1059(-)